VQAPRLADTRGPEEVYALPRNPETLSEKVTPQSPVGDRLSAPGDASGYHSRDHPEVVSDGSVGQPCDGLVLDAPDPDIAQWEAATCIL